jgi:hypothetical protein
MCKCADPELEWQIRCFPYEERSDVPRFQQVEQKAVGRQRNLGLLIHMLKFKLCSEMIAGIYPLNKMYSRFFISFYNCQLS